ncbi:DUF1883 domain-containing protein [Priestia aryabhattai]|uniref:DUF1883 domain-containing protein n=1 Tax=Priestia aryabhattai TaxID=412384 RepID=UPI003AF20C9F
MYLKHAGDIFLVNRMILHKYHQGQRFNYLGGHYKEIPLNILVRVLSIWYLIV